MTHQQIFFLFDVLLSEIYRLTKTEMEEGTQMIVSVTKLFFNDNNERA